MKTLAMYNPCERRQDDCNSILRRGPLAGEHRMCENLDKLERRIKRLRDFRRQPSSRSSAADAAIKFHHSFLHNLTALAKPKPSAPRDTELCEPLCSQNAA